MTITDKNIILTMLRNGGVYSGDPPMPLIYRYESLEGQTYFAVFSNPDFDDLATGDTAYCRNVTCLLANCILTKAGQEFLEKRQ